MSMHTGNSSGVGGGNNVKMDTVNKMEPLKISEAST